MWTRLTGLIRHRAGSCAEGPAHRGGTPWSRPGAELRGLIVNAPAAVVFAVACVVATLSSGS